MDIKAFTRSYWNYYLELEKRMEETRRYIEYDEHNFKTYSSNYLILFQAVCSEIDVVGKELAAYFNPDFEKEDGTKPINRWWYEIQNALPGVDREIMFSDSYQLRPWGKYRVVKAVSTQNRNGKRILVTRYNLQRKEEGETSATPKWWTAYNKVKHMRLKTDNDGINYKKANLVNLSKAFAALYLLEFEFMKKIGTKAERVECGRSCIFGMGDLQDSYVNAIWVEDNGIIVT